MAQIHVWYQSLRYPQSFASERNDAIAYGPVERSATKSFRTDKSSGGGRGVELLDGIAAQVECEDLPPGHRGRPKKKRVAELARLKQAAYEKRMQDNPPQRHSSRIQFQKVRGRCGVVAKNTKKMPFIFFLRTHLALNKIISYKY